MHEDTANGVMAKSAPLVETAVDALCEADQMWRGTLIGKLRGVLNEKYGPFRSIIARACGREVPAENIAFINAVIGEKPIGRLRVRPVLACERNSLAHAITHLPQELPKSSTKTGVFESSFVDLATAIQVLSNESQPILSIQEFYVSGRATNSTTHGELKAWPDAYCRCRSLRQQRQQCPRFLMGNGMRGTG